MPSPADSLAFDDAELERLRRDTRLCASGRVHLNNAGASPSPEPVLRAVIEHLELEASVGGYEAAEAAADRLAAVYESCARLVGGQACEIALQESATRAWQAAFAALPLEPGQRILTSCVEYGSNAIAMMQRAERCGARLEVLPAHCDGRIDLAALRFALARGDVAFVALPWVPSQSGLVEPVAEIGALTRSHGVPLLLDACQAVGQLEVDVEALGCDLLTATGRKFLRAPRGTGFLWIRRALLERLEPELLDLRGADWVAPRAWTVRDDARRFETWEASAAARLGLGVAAEYALAIGPRRIEHRVCTLAARLREGLAVLPGITVTDPPFGDAGTVRSNPSLCGIVTFASVHEDAESLRTRLAAAGVQVSVTTASVARLDLEARGYTSLVRASVHYFNDARDLERMLEVVAAGGQGRSP